ncbi:MAG: efflux RND transporter periplasmic adaptor subunit [Desulfovibrio sp.]|nr:efflux RND transporter periplasmic adaptor subunit [Desulfovibrio sp.]
MTTESKTGEKSLERRYGGWALALLLAGLAAFTLWGIIRAAFPPTPPMQGQMEARVISVSSKSPGRVGQVMVREGEDVSKDQPVAVMSLPGLDAKLRLAEARKEAALARESMVDEGLRPEQIAAAKARWEAAQAEATLAAKTWRRIRALFGDGLVSAERNDQARAAAESSAQEAAAARKEYDLALAGSRSQEKEAAADASAEASAGVAEIESLTDDALLLAPRSGQIDRVLLVEGELASAGFPILTIVDLADQWVTFNILEKDMPSIKMGEVLKASVPAIARNNVDFRIYYISPRANYATWRSTREDSGYDMKTFEVRARPVGNEPGLRPGMSVLVKRP